MKAEILEFQHQGLTTGFGFIFREDSGFRSDFDDEGEMKKFETKEAALKASEEFKIKHKL